MRKRILCILLALCLVLCLMPTAVYAMQIRVDLHITGADGETLTLEVESGSSVDSVKETIRAKKGIAPERQQLYFNDRLLENGRTLADYNVQKECTLRLELIGTALTKDCIRENGILPAGIYYLNEPSFTLSQPLSIRGNVTLDLNGNVLDLNGHYIYAGGILTLVDSAPAAQHKFTDNGSGLWVLNENGDKLVTGGVITGGRGFRSGDVVRGGAIYTPGGSTVVMNGGSIVGCTAGSGSAVWAMSDFVMNGGMIAGCCAEDQDGVDLFVFNMIANGGAVYGSTLHYRTVFLSDSKAGTVFHGPITGPARSGSGTQKDPYLIYTAEGLKAFADTVNGTNGETQNTNACARLMADIVLNDGTFDEDGGYTSADGSTDAQAWKPIGFIPEDNNGNHSNCYTGTFDGNGYTIQGLYVKDAAYAGLFGAAKGAVIKNTSVTGYVCANRRDCGDDAYAAGIVGHAIGTAISRCSSSAAVIAAAAPLERAHLYAGGIAGRSTAAGTITDCCNLGTVKAIGGICCNAGGIAGCIDSSDNVSVRNVTNCYNIGKILARDGQNASNAGGIVGYNSEGASITNCYGVGTVTAASAAYCGGIAGYSGFDPEDGTPAAGSTISNCYWLTDAEGKPAQAAGGGLITATIPASPKSASDFADPDGDGSVLKLLQAGDEDSSWDKCGFAATVNMTLPLLKGRTGNSHEHVGGSGDCTLAFICTLCGHAIQGNAEHNWSVWTTDSRTNTQTRHCLNTGCAKTETRSTSSSGYYPTIQKPEITIIGSGKVTLSTDGSMAAIAAEEGSELTSVTLNGKEIAKTEKLTGLKTGDKVVITFRKKADNPAFIAKTVSEKISRMQFTARSSVTAKKNIRVILKGDTQTTAAIRDIQELGCTVKYRFYRSTKKSDGFKPMLTKNEPKYLNTIGKKNTMYYYRAVAMVYDKDGSLIAKSELKQCRYANRKWVK